MQNIDRIANLEPSDPTAAPVLGYFALWLSELGLGHVGCEVKFSQMDLVASALRRMPSAPRPRLAVNDCAHLEMTEGLVALFGERCHESVLRLNKALQLTSETTDQLLRAAIQAALARAYARQGKYRKSLQAIHGAITTALAQGHDELAAAYLVRQAWTLAQSKKCKYATVAAMFESADRVLEPTDDWITRGNISAALAKIASHRGFYEEGLRRYTSSIERYENCDPSHPNLARALVNRGQLRIQIAGRLMRSGGPSGRRPEGDPGLRGVVSDRSGGSRSRRCDL